MSSQKYFLITENVNESHIYFNPSILRIILFENGRFKHDSLFPHAMSHLIFFHTLNALISTSRGSLQFSWISIERRWNFGLHIELHVNLFLYLFLIVFCFKFNCCAVNPVTEVKNDFDKTPWCTTEGECHDINAKIPKTCCVGVNARNFEQEAPRSCFVHLNTGDFKTTV